MPQFLRRLGIKLSPPAEGPAEPRHDGGIQVLKSEASQRSPSTLVLPTRVSLYPNSQRNKRRTRPFAGHLTSQIWSPFGGERRAAPSQGESLAPWSPSSDASVITAPLPPPHRDHSCARLSHSSPSPSSSPPPTPTEELPFLQQYHNPHIAARSASDYEGVLGQQTDTVAIPGASQRKGYSTCGDSVDESATKHLHELSYDLDISEDFTSSPSKDCRQLLESHLWPQPLRNHSPNQETFTLHDSSPLFAQEQRPDLSISMVNEEKQPIFDMDESTSESLRASARRLYDNPNEAFRNINRRNALSGTAGEFHPDLRTPVETPPRSPFEYAADLDPTIPRYELSPTRANALARVTEPSDTLESLIGNYDVAPVGNEFSEANLPNSRRESSDGVSTRDPASDPAELIAQLERASRDNAFAHGDLAQVGDVSQLLNLLNTRREARENTIVRGSPSDPNAHFELDPADNAPVINDDYAHVQHELSTIFEASTPSASQSVLKPGNSLPDRRAQSAAPAPGLEVNRIARKPIGSVPVNPATSPVLPPPLFQETPPSFKNPFESSSASPISNDGPYDGSYGTSSVPTQTPSTRILFPRERSTGGKFTELFDHEASQEELMLSPPVQHPLMYLSKTDRGPDLQESIPLEESQSAKARAGLVQSPPNVTMRRTKRECELRNMVPLPQSPSSQLHKVDKPSFDIPREWSNGSIRRKKLTIRDVSPHDVSDETSGQFATDSEYYTSDDSASAANTLDPSRTQPEPFSPVDYNFMPSPPLFMADRQRALSPTQLREHNTDMSYRNTPRQLTKGVAQGSEGKARQRDIEDTIHYENSYDNVVRLGMDAMSGSTVHEKGKSRKSFESWTTVEQVNSQQFRSPGPRFSAMLKPLVGSKQRSPEVVKKGLQKYEAYKTAQSTPLGSAKSGGRPRGLGITFDGRDDSTVSRDPGPVEPPSVYSTRRQSRAGLSYGPREPDFQPISAPWKQSEGSPRVVGHKAHQASYLTDDSATTPSYVTPTTVTHQSGPMIGRFPSPGLPNMARIRDGFRPAQSDYSAEGFEDIPLEPVRKPNWNISRSMSEDIPQISDREYNRRMVAQSAKWHEKPLSVIKSYCTNGRDIFRVGITGSRERLVDRLPVAELPPQHSSYGSRRHKEGERFAWAALVCLAFVPFLIPLYAAGTFDLTFRKITKNDWAAPSDRQKQIATRIFYVWGILVFLAIMVTVIAVVRVHSLSQPA